MTADDALTAPPDNPVVAEVTLRIVYEENPWQNRPEKWDWDRLLKLRGNESVVIVKYEELGSYDEIIDTAVENER